MFNMNQSRFFTLQLLTLLSVNQISGIRLKILMHRWKEDTIKNDFSSLGEKKESKHDLPNNFLHTDYLNPASSYSREGIHAKKSFHEQEEYTSLDMRNEEENLENIKNFRAHSKLNVMSEIDEFIDDSMNSFNDKVTDIIDRLYESDNSHLILQESPIDLSVKKPILNPIPEQLPENGGILRSLLTKPLMVESIDGSEKPILNPFPEVLPKNEEILRALLTKPLQVESVEGNGIKKPILNPVPELLPENGRILRTLLTKPLMAELVEGSGVKIKKKILDNFVSLYKSHPRMLIRKLIKHLIPIQNLITRPSNVRYEYEIVPKNILDAIEVFVQRVAEPKLEHDLFLKTFSNLVVSLQKKHENSNLPKVSVDQIIKSPENNFFVLSNDPLSKVEIVEGSGVEINANLLSVLVRTYKSDPRKLQTRLLQELIPAEELKQMYVTSRHSNKFIPLNIRDAVQIFVNRVSERKIDRREFMTNLKNFLQYLRRKEKKKKEYSTS